ncbi:MAG: serine protease [Melioribacteraceae bacterium]
MTVSAQVVNSVFAIVKLSYNENGESSVIGGICGSAFLINDSTVITAHHVLNSKVKPNEGYKYCQFWLLNRNGSLIIPIEQKQFEDYKEMECTIIHLQKPLNGIPFLSIESNDVKIGDEVYSLGHVGDKMPVTKAEWNNGKLLIQSYSLKNLETDKNGNVKEIKKATIRANDVNIVDVEVIQPTFGAVVGMSGGPLIAKRTNKLIGLMSFGMPADSVKKEIVYAISSNELYKKFIGNSNK